MIPPPVGNGLRGLEPVDSTPAEVLDSLPASTGRWTRAWRSLSTWSPTSAPVALLLTVGIVLGPQGINLLTPAARTFLDPVMPVTLAALGVLVGLTVSGGRRDEPRLLGAACLAATITWLIVSAGFAMVAAATASWDAAPMWIVVMTAGICAASSLTLPSDDAIGTTSAATRVIELGVLLPIVSGGLILAWLRTGSTADAGALVAQACGAILAVAASAWLLLTRTSSETEERVFAVSALLLVGGVAAALFVSALMGGLVAGALLRSAGRHPRDAITRDVLFVQHPLVVLVLLTAGADAELSPTALAIGAGYAAFRAVGQLAAGAVASRVIGPTAPRDLGLHLLQPGVFGVGFALNAVSVTGAEASSLLAAVVVGTIASECLAVLLPPRSLGA